MNNGNVENEIWRPIVGYEGLYEVSSCGNVKSLKKTIDKGKFGKVDFPEIILQPLLSHKELSTAYLRVNLYRDKQHRAISIHRLVASAFIPNPDQLPQVNHQDGNKLNNVIENLEWVTAKENTHHAIKSGIFSSPPRGEKNGQSKLTSEAVFFIRNSRGQVTRKKLSEMFGVTIKHIDRVRQGKRWKEQ